MFLFVMYVVCFCFAGVLFHSGGVVCWGGGKAPCVFCVTKCRLLVLLIVVGVVALSCTLLCSFWVIGKMRACGMQASVGSYVFTTRAPLNVGCQSTRHTVNSS